MTTITRRVRKPGKKSQGGNPIQKCPPKGIWTGQGGRPISRRKKAKNSKQKKREKGRMKATGITQRHIVCLKQGLGRGSGTLVDLETTEKTKGTTCESTVVKTTTVTRKVMKIGEKS
jgi:hypothetical protein